MSMVDPVAVAIFLLFVGAVLFISFYMGSRAKSARGYYAAHGQINWFVNGVAFAGDYLSAASFLGICGMLAFYGYDGFLYSIGFLAGWIVALLVIAEPLKRLGKFTFADALDRRFNSRGIKLTAAISTLLVSLLYLIPQMVGAGSLVKPLLGLPHWAGVLIVGVIVIIIVVTAGMVSTTYVQFIKGSLLVFFCAILTVLILSRGLSTEHTFAPSKFVSVAPTPAHDVLGAAGVHLVEPTGPWVGKPYVRVQNTDGSIDTYRTMPGDQLIPAQTVETVGDKTITNGKPDGVLYPVGQITRLPGDVKNTGPLGPIKYIKTFQDSTIITWGTDKTLGTGVTVYYPKISSGNSLLTPGAYPLFAGIRSNKITEKLDFISLMLSLFCGTAALPHILIRYYTVKDQQAARRSTVTGIATIGFFYILTLYLGLGAMTSGALNVQDINSAAPLLAKTFGHVLFAVISAIAFTTVLGTVSGLIIASSGAVAHDLMTNFMKMEMDDHQKVMAGKYAAVVVGIVAIVLGILFKDFNAAFLVGWAFNVAASANLPSLIMLLFWKRTTKQGITAAVAIGLISSIGWLMLTKSAYSYIYHSTAVAPAPFSQPGIVTIPLGFIVLIVVSLLTQPAKATRGGFPVSAAAA